MTRDRVQNSLGKARRVNLDRGNFRFRDAISASDDLDDLYRVKIGTRSTVDLKLSRQQRGGNADVEVFALKKRRRAVFNAIGDSDFSDLQRRDIRQNLNRIGRSRKRGRRNETLSLSLDPGMYFVRVYPKAGETRYKLTLKPTTVVGVDPIQPTITVTAPNGGETLVRGQTSAITWDDSIDENVKIDLFSNGILERTVVASTTSDGRYNWTVPNNLTIGNDYTLRISSTTDASLFDDSDSPFAVQPAASTSTFDITFDYRFDTQGWFTAERRAALEAAAAIWEAIIQDEFSNVPIGTALSVTNPETGANESFNSDVVIDDILIFAGARNLSSAGFGGPSATFFIGSELDNRFNGSDFEPWTGSITFDVGTNWFFDSTPSTATDIPSSSLDFISVAVHEIAHVLGFSTSDAFDALVSGTSFAGPQAIARNGGNPIPLEANLGHIQNGYSFGNSGETALDPNVMVGDRKLPTRLDAAIMDDIGYIIDYSQTFQNA